MDYGKYHNCLRIQITPDDRVDERVDNLVEHCYKYGFDNVILMLNLEEFNLGHITMPEAKKWVDELKKAKRKLEEKGITVSVNNWMELGHVDRGRKLREGQDFGLMVDWEGRKATLIACPLSVSWREYFAEYVKLLVSELSPDTFWIEDDFRLQGHPPLVGVGCFCDEHMKLYNSRLNKEYTREEFVEKIFKPGGLNPEREVWLDVNRDAMLSLAEHIADTVKSVKSDCDVALMTSWPGGHCIEGRDWQKIYAVLGKNGGHKINRLHLSYGEASGKDFMHDVNTVDMPIRAMCDDDVLILPEIERGSSNLYGGGRRWLKFTLEGAIPLVLSGMTYSIYDFVGNGARDSFGFGEIVHELQPYMQKILDQGIKFSEMQGVIIPIDQRASYKKEYVSDLGDLYPKEYVVGAYLSGLGITYKYSTEKKFKDKTVFLPGSSIDYFTDGELKDVFADNFVVLDGTGVLKLKDRRFLNYIGAKNAVLRTADSGYHTYEECRDDNLYIEGVRKLRASGRYGAGNFVEVDYIGDVDVKTDVFNERMQRLAVSYVEGKNFAVLPFCLDKKVYAQFCDLRRYFLTQTLINNTCGLIVMDKTGISPYIYDKKDKKILVLVNANVDNYDEIGFTYTGEISNISKIGKDGEIVRLEFTRQGNHYTVKDGFEYLSSTVLIID